MSLDTVAADIRDEARARAEEIVSDAEAEAYEIVSDAEAEASTIREEREAEVERTIEQEREQRLSSAKLEAKQARLEARRDVLEEVKEAVEAEIAGLSGETREELTRALLEDAVAEFPDDAEIAISGAPDDEDLLRSLVSGRENCHYDGEFDCLGGVVAESRDSQVRVKNTFDSVLEDVWEDDLREISQRLFDAQ